MTAFQNREFKTYLFSYRYEGADCVLEIRAEGMEDAKRRVSRLQYATYDGELMAKLPVHRKLSGVMTPLLSFFLWLVTLSRKN